VIESAALELTPLIGVAAACVAVGRSRATHYRAHRVSPAAPPRPAAGGPSRQPPDPTEDHQARVLEVLHSPRFVDMAPAAVYATLLDEGVYLCSESTMYRLLRHRGETGHRRWHSTHPAKVKPEMVTRAPNEVWSWDIAKSHGPKEVDLLPRATRLLAADWGSTRCLRIGGRNVFAVHCRSALATTTARNRLHAQ